jgi:hypothetical protein
VKLSVVITTRNRTHLLVPTVRATVKNARNPNTTVTVMVDEDDRQTVQATPQLQRMGARVITVPRPKSFGTKFNLGVAAESADVYVALVDYAPFLTEGFDQKILDASTMYPDGYAVMMNWLCNLTFPTLNAVTHKLVEKMSGIYPEFFPYWFVDHHLLDVARMIDRIVFVDVQIDRSARKEEPGRPWTTNKRETWFWALLFDVMAEERKAQAQSIIESDDFVDTPIRKKVLINNFPWIIQQSMLVNSYARKDLGGDFTTDAWYEQVKATGVAKMKELLTPEQWKEVEAMQANADKQIMAAA